MAINLDEKYPGRAQPKSVRYPQGAFKNRTAPDSQDGTYLEQDWANDMSGFLQWLLANAGITANGDVDNALASQYAEALKILINDTAVPTASVSAFAGSSAPSGWLFADGSQVSRATYPKLFASIGTTYGSGNGSTTFNLPDLRGEFIRGLDRGRGIDPSRALGSRQIGSLNTIDSTIPAYTVTGLYNSDTPESEAAQRFGMDKPNPADYPGGRYVGIDSNGTPATILAEPNNFGVTRPRNIAMNYIIKAI